MGSTKHVTIRIPEVFVRQAERVALRDDRSVSWVLQSWMQAGFTTLECSAGDKEKRDGNLSGRSIEEIVAGSGDVAAGSGDKEGQQDQVRAVLFEVQPQERKPESASRREFVPAQPTKNFPTCPRCGESKGVVPWGSGHRCQDCKVNF